jgi:hypothetical protein
MSASWILLVSVEAHQYVKPTRRVVHVRLTSNQASEVVEDVTQYVRSHLDRVYSDSLPEAELLNLLGGNGGAQVDAVIYLVIQGECSASTSLDLQLLTRP